MTWVTYQGTDHAEPRRTWKGLWLLIRGKWGAMRGVWAEEQHDLTGMWMRSFQLLNWNSCFTVLWKHFLRQKTTGMAIKFSLILRTLNKYLFLNTILNFHLWDCFNETASWATTNMASPRVEVFISVSFQWRGRKQSCVSATDLPTRGQHKRWVTVVSYSELRPHGWNIS